MLDRMTQSIDFHGTALALRAKRQEVLSSNIANADTPGFKARDFDFSAALQAATGVSAGSLAGRLAGAPAGGTGATGGTGIAGPSTAALAAGGGATLALARSDGAHLPAAAGGAGGGARGLQYVTPEQGTLDGNTVDLNRERAQFADNALRYEASLRFINGGYRTMLSAIRGE